MSAGGETVHTALPSSSTGAALSRALAYLALRSLSNRTRQLAARLSEPRYLVAFLVGLAYFAWIFGTMLRRGEREREITREVFALAPWSEALAPLPLLLLAVGWWTLGNYQTALAFTPAEVHFLFTAPAPRRALIRYKLAKKQLGILFTALLGSLYLFLMSGGALGLGGSLLRFVGLWLLVTTMHLHQLAASLVRTAALEQGWWGLRRQWLPLSAFAVALATVAGAAWGALPALRSAADLPGALGVLAATLDEPAPRAVLLPFRWALAPLFASDLDRWLATLLPAFTLLALHYLWVLGTDAAFEEGAAEAGRGRAARTRALLQGRTTAYLSRRGAPARPWLALGAGPRRALFWKNLTLAARTLSASSAFLLLGVFAGSYFLMRALGEDHGGAATIVTAMALTTFALTFAAGSIFIRNDLRTDLGKLELVRTWPLAGRDVVAAELAASTATLTIVQLLFLFIGLAFLLMAGAPDPWWSTAAGLGAILALLPPLNALLLGAQNALALLFPAWTRIGSSRPGGVEQMGMFMLNLLVTLLFLALALLPGLVVAAGAVLALGTTSPGAFVAAGVGSWVALCGEVALLVDWLGDVYDDLDPSDAGLLG